MWYKTAIEWIGRTKHILWSKHSICWQGVDIEPQTGLLNRNGLSPVLHVIEPQTVVRKLMWQTCQNYSEHTALVSLIWLHCTLTISASKSIVLFSAETSKQMYLFGSLVQATPLSNNMVIKHKVFFTCANCDVVFSLHTTNNKHHRMTITKHTLCV